jgi:hypothetical protein
MTPARWLGLVLVVLGITASTRARAQHHHEVATAVAPHELGVRIAVSAIAARFDTGIYAGDYEGVALAAGFARGRFAVHAVAPLYRLRENGADRYGPGDVMFGGDAIAFASRAWMIGGSVMAGAPTGDGLAGLGMGHTMAMGSAWARFGAGRVSLTGAVGYARAFSAESHHDHGAWPLVEPMNMAEVTSALAADVTVARRWRVGGRGAIGVPTSTGATRLIAAGVIRWVGARLDVAAELQIGVVGDPFKLRAVVETAVHY